MAATAREHLRDLGMPAALGCALAAQKFITEQPTSIEAWLSYAGAAVLFLLSSGRWSHLPPAHEEPVVRSGSSGRSIALGAVALFVAVGATAASAAGLFPVAVVFAWSLALLLALLAVRGRQASPVAPRSPWTTREVAALVLILILAAAARFSWIDTLPARYFDDEARLGMYLWRPPHRITSYFNLGWNSWPILGIAAQGLLAMAAGVSTVTLRQMSAVYGTLAVGTTYLAARQLFSVRIALLAALLLAINRTAIDISRLGTAHAQVLMLAPLAFALWWSGVNRGRAGRYLGAGIVMGLSMHTYNAGQLVVVVWLAWTFIAALSRPWRALYARGAALTFVGFVLAVMPLAYQITGGFGFGAQWNEWLSIGRGRQVTGEMIQRLATDGPAKAFELLGNQAAANWFGFFAIPSRAYELGYRGGGMLDDVTAVLFFIGLALCVAGRFSARGVFVALWWTLTVLVAGVLTRDPPVFQRLVALLPAVAILAALPLERLLISARDGWRRVVAGAIVIASLTWAGWRNWQTYFVEFAAQPLDFTSTLARAVGDFPADRPVLLSGSEYAWRAAGWQQHQFSFQHELMQLDFADRRLHEVGEPAHLFPLRSAASPPPVVILGPTQINQLDFIGRLYPGAEVRRLGDGERVAVAVALTPADIERASGLRLRRIAATGVVDLGVADPVSSLPAGACPASGACTLEWSGRIYWPGADAMGLRVVADGLEEVWLAGEALPTTPGGSMIADGVVLPLGWHPFRLRQLGQGTPSMALRRGSNVIPLSRGDFSPDERQHGLLATYSREGQVVGRSIDPQLNYAVDERLFRSPTNPRFRMPFQARWEGALRIEEAGVYRFELETNSRAGIELDESLLVDLSETAPDKRVVKLAASRHLEPGDHPIIAEWEAGPAFAPYPRAIFQLSWIPPDGELQLIPPSAFVPAAR